MVSYPLQTQTHATNRCLVMPRIVFSFLIFGWRRQWWLRSKMKKKTKYVHGSMEYEVKKTMRLNQIGAILMNQLTVISNDQVERFSGSIFLSFVFHHVIEDSRIKTAYLMKKTWYPTLCFKDSNQKRSLIFSRSWRGYQFWRFESLFVSDLWNIKRKILPYIPIMKDLIWRCWWATWNFFKREIAVIQRS